MDKNNKCVFGYCKGNKDNSFNCQKCGESTKKQGYTGCVYATYENQEVTDNE